MAITFNEYGLHENVATAKISGLSTDTKPLIDDRGIAIVNGSTFIEVDTGDVYKFDAENQIWYISGESVNSRISTLEGKLNMFPRGLNYMGEVDYVADLPDDARVGDAYTVKYSGSSGTTPLGSLYAWGDVDGVNEWIEQIVDVDLSQYYTKTETDSVTGDLADLDTTDKSNLVAAVNEVKDDVAELKEDSNIIGVHSSQFNMNADTAHSSSSDKIQMVVNPGDSVIISVFTNTTLSGSGRTYDVFGYSANSAIGTKIGTGTTNGAKIKIAVNAAYSALGVYVRILGVASKVTFLVENEDSVIGKLYGMIDASSVPINSFMNGINHRGYCTAAPENTIPAYKLSKLYGFDTVETDIEWTSDGIPVLLHDSTIDRTSDGEGNVGDYTYEELLEFDFGSWKSETYAGTKIPTFDEFMKLCRNLGLKAYIEIKGLQTQGRIDLLIGIVRKYRMIDNVTWISSDRTSLARILTTQANARIGITQTLATDALIDDAVRMKTDVNAVFINVSTITDDEIESCIENGIPVEMWTVNSQTDMLNANGYISGFTSDSINAKEIFSNVNNN